MKYVDEYRDAAVARGYAERLRTLVTRPWKVMEACGGQTHTIVKFGIDRLIPESVELIHGPGCPVCVTPMSSIDAAIRLAARPGTVVCSFGDMLRVPGSRQDLLTAKAQGGDVRVVYSPLDALKIARENPEREVVFFAVGFETTAPANAMAVYQAARDGVRNFSLLVSQVLVPPALEAILASREHAIDGFLAPGHVCTITGYRDYERIAETHRVPIVVTGFEPVDILQGLHMCVLQLQSGRHEVENQYTRSVRRDGNPAALALLNEVFCVSDKHWRGLGELKGSGLKLTPRYRLFDAEHRFGLAPESAGERSECISGQILQGIKKPSECPQFGRGCRPERPLGATMVSSEGACSAYFRYRGGEARP